MVSEFDVIPTIIGILFLVIPAMLLGKLCSRFKISEIIGFVIAGVFLGPFALGGIIPFGDRPLVVLDAETPTQQTPQILLGQIGLADVNFWPFVQMYNFVEMGDVIIQYNKGGMVITRTLTFNSEIIENGTVLMYIFSQFYA